MRNRLLFCAIFLSILFVGNVVINAGAAQDSESSPAKYLIVYYFHGNFRCTSCLRIEQYTKEVTEQYFQEELQSGRVIFKAINVEEPGNEHFIKDYQLYTRSVVLSIIEKDKEAQYKNLTKVWNYLRNKQKFYDYVKDEINKYLEEL